MRERRRMLLAAVLGAMVMIPGATLARKSVHAWHGVAMRAPQTRNSSTAPGAEQASLAKLAGEYDRVVKFVGQTGAAATPSSGTSKFSVILGGRFLLEESNDVVFGQPVEGVRIYGYNNATGQYEMARMYTMSTGITMMKGTSSDGGKTIEYAGQTDTSSGYVPLHAELRVVSENEFTVTMSTTGAEGKLTPFQETIYTRKK